MFIYLSPLLMRLTGADHNVVGIMFAIYGVAGFAGNVIATRIVSALGGWVTSAVFLGSTFIGMTLWSLGAGFLSVMGIGIVFWGLGFAATNSMQQARLVVAAPDLSSATVGLNTSALYTGQAIGSAIRAAYCSATGICTASATLRRPPSWRLALRFGRSPVTARWGPDRRLPRNAPTSPMRPESLSFVQGARDQRLDLWQHARDHDGVALRVVVRVIARPVFTGRQVPLRISHVFRVGDVVELEAAEADRQHLNLALA